MTTTSPSATGASETADDTAERAARGDKTALGALFERYSDPLWRHIYARCGGSASMADDITSATWERIVSRIEQFDPAKGSFPAWLYRIGERLAAEIGRRANVGRELEIKSHMLNYGQSKGIDGLGPDVLAVRRDEAERIIEKLSVLPERYRTAIILTVFEGLSSKDAAEIMGTTDGSVRQARFRGLRELAKFAERPAVDLYVPGEASCASGGVVQHP